MGQRSDRPKGHRLRYAQSALDELQRAAAGDHAIGRTQTALALAAGAAGSNSIPHYLLREELGFLPAAQTTRAVAGRLPAFDVQWPEADRTIVDRDANYPDYVADKDVT